MLYLLLANAYPTRCGKVEYSIFNWTFLNLIRDETGLFVASRESPVMYRLLEMKDSIARYGYTETVRNVFKDKAPRVLEIYPAPNDPEDLIAEEDVIVALTTDFFFTCPTVAITGSNVRSNISGIRERFLYQFTQVPSFLPVLGIVNTQETKFTIF